MVKMKFIEVKIYLKIILLLFVNLPSSINAVAAHDNEVCHTEACGVIDQILLRNMNHSANPCTNFYDYICKFKTFLTPGLDQIKSRQLSKENMQITELIEKIDADRDPVIPFRLIKKYFDACKNYVSNRHRPSHNILPEIMDKLRPRRLDFDFDWIAVTEVLVNDFFYSHYLFDFAAEPSLFNQSKIVFQIKGVHEDFTYSDYLKTLNDYENSVIMDEFIRDYSDAMGNTHKQKSEPYFSAWEIILDVTEFMTELEEIMNLHKGHNKVRMLTIRRLTEIVPQIPWIDVIKSFLSSLSNVTVTDDIFVSVVDVQYLKELGKLISSTSPKVLMNYIILISYMDYKFREKSLEIGADACLDFIRNELQVVLALLSSRSPELFYLQKYVVNVANLMKKQTMKTIYNEWNWMNMITTVRLYAMIDLMNVKVLYDDLEGDIKKATKSLSGFEFNDNNDFYSMELKFFKFEHKLKFKKIHISENESVETTSRTEKPSYDSIYLSLHFLQDLWVATDLPDYINFATIGRVIVRQIIRQIFNDRINEKWDQMSEDKLGDKIYCTHDLNQDFLRLNPQLNPKRVIYGIMEETASLQIAYQTYIEWLKETKKPQLMLPSFHESSEKMFFLTTGLYSCLGGKLPRMIDDIEVNTNVGIHQHPPAQLKFLALPANVPQFSKFYNCSIDHEMDLRRSCSYNSKKTLRVYRSYIKYQDLWASGKL